MDAILTDLASAADLIQAAACALTVLVSFLLMGAAGARFDVVDDGEG